MFVLVDVAVNPYELCPSCLQICVSSRHCQYGGDDEYYLQVRQAGTLAHEEENEEKQTEHTKETLHATPCCVHMFMFQPSSR